MKKLLLFSISLSLGFITGLGQAKTFPDLVGRWEFAGEQNAGATLEIIDSSHMFITYLGERRRITNVHMDFSKSPAWFDFVTGDSSSTWHVQSLLEIGDNVMKWQVFIDENRPAYFSKNTGELLYLKKQHTQSSTAKSF